MHKLKLPLGPWTHEPNEKHWVDPATGLHCCIKRHPDLLHLCGYVGVPTNHPAYGRDYDALELSVHGDITHADFRSDSPMPDLWWIGFDCAHARDYSPGALHFYGATPKDYRDMEYATRECTELAAQLVDYVSPMSVHEALTIVVHTAEQAIGKGDKPTLEEACAIVREHIERLED